MRLHVHLVFGGNCEEAFQTYQELFKGEIVFVFRKGEDKTMEVTDEEKNKISHMVMNTPHFSLQGEDADLGATVYTGSSKLVLECWNKEDTNRLFNALSQGGSIISPLEKTFFSEAFGEVIDRFGIRWLIMMTDEDYGK